MKNRLLPGVRDWSVVGPFQIWKEGKDDLGETILVPFSSLNTVTYLIVKIIKFTNDFYLPGIHSKWRDPKH